MTVEELSSGLKNALYIASREKDRQAAQVASMSWSLLVRWAAAASEPASESHLSWERLQNPDESCVSDLHKSAVDLIIISLMPHAAVKAATESFKAGLLDTLLKKKSRLHRTTLEELAAAAPAVAAPVLPEVLQVPSPLFLSFLNIHL